MRAIDGVSPRAAGSTHPRLALTNDPRLHRLEAYVESHMHRKITLSNAAAVAGLEPTYFSRHFREEVGVTFSQWLRCFRVDRAKPLLRTEHIKIVDIAQRVGFNDTTTFGRAFKECVGLSPRAFRAEFWTGYDDRHKRGSTRNSSAKLITGD